MASAIRQGGPTVEDVVREHIDLLNHLGEDTRTGFRLRARDHTDPHQVPLPVTGVTRRIATSWVREPQERGLAPKSISNVHGLLSAAMNTALRLGYRIDNPCTAARLPRSQRAGEEMVVLARSRLTALPSTKEVTTDQLPAL